MMQEAVLKRQIAEDEEEKRAMFLQRQNGRKIKKL